MSEYMGGFTGPGQARSEQIHEVLVFLALIVPSMVLSLFAVREGGISFNIAAVSTILRDLGLLTLIFFFIWRNREPLANLGWHENRPARTAEDILLGIVLYVPFFFIVQFAEIGLRALGLKPPSTPLPAVVGEGGIIDVVLGTMLVAVVAITEETIFRGYLILRLRNITRSPAAAVVLSTIIFTLGHGYEGTLGLASVALMGFMLALVYLWRGSLVMPITLHFVQNFLGIVLIPLLMKGSGK